MSDHPENSTPKTEEELRDELRAAAFDEPATESEVAGLRLRPFSTKTVELCEKYQLTMFMGEEESLGRTELLHQVAVFAWMQSAPIPEVQRANREGTWEDAVDAFKFDLTPQKMKDLLRECGRVASLAGAGAFDLQRKASELGGADEDEEGDAPGNS